jgi:hypothetical protein
LLENPCVHPDAVRRAVEQATIQRCSGQRSVFVAVDGTSLAVTDEKRTKGLGAIGAWDKGARGVHAMTALALSSDGATVGMCGQRMWVREARSVHGRHHRRKAPTENRVWLDVLCDVQAAFAKDAPGCTPWFQLDRGGDCWQVLTLARELGMLLTVRAAYDRCVHGPDVRLWAAVERTRVVATREVLIPARPEREKNKRVGGKRIKVVAAARTARTAKVAIQAASVPILCRTLEGRQFVVTLNAVLVKELGHKNEPLEWMLLTTHSIRTRKDVLRVVQGYALRWRIEEFHRAWKRGLCRVEDTQLRSRDAIYKWSTILAAVATRAMRLTYLARTTPDVPATTELSRGELAALIALREPKGVRDDDVPTLAVAVRWLADLGGYTGPWNGPPGPTVVGRGLYDVLVAARVLKHRHKKR